MLQTKVQSGLTFNDIVNRLIDEDIRFSEVPMELQDTWKDGDIDGIRDEEVEVYQYYDSCPDF